MSGGRWLANMRRYLYGVFCYGASHPRLKDVSMADDVAGRVAAALRELRDATNQLQVSAGQARADFHDRVVESRAALMRSRALLERLDGHKPPRFP